MTLTSLLWLAGALAGGPEVRWNAPSAYIAGQSYRVHVEIVAPEGGTAIASWMLTPAAFTLDGKPLAKREEGGVVKLPAGFTITGDVDLGSYIEAKSEFSLGYASEVAGGEPMVVQVFVPAPDGLDFNTMPVAELAQYQVLLQTNRGDIQVKFWPEVAPNHVRNFLDLAYTKYYEGTVFHRVIPGFMIQGGNVATRGNPSATEERDGPRRLNLEPSDKKHVRGVLSMARTPDPNSASTQFFVMQANATHLDGQYSAFGETVSGLDVVDKIVNSPRGPGDRPREPQVIERTLVFKAAVK